MSAPTTAQQCTHYVNEIDHMINRIRCLKTRKALQDSFNESFEIKDDVKFKRRLMVLYNQLCKHFDAQS